MARKNMTLAIAILIAMVALLPAWGQTGSAVTTTLSKLMFGQDPTDPTMTWTWTTTMRVVNRTPDAAHNEITAMSPVCPSITTVYGGTVAADCSDISYISPLGEDRRLFAYPAVATSSQATIESLQNADGIPVIVASATVQETDAKGNIVASYEVVDPTTVAKNPGTSFGFGADIGVEGVDTNIVLAVPRSVSCPAPRRIGGGTLDMLRPDGRCGDPRIGRIPGENLPAAAQVTVSIYDGYNTATGNRTPLASITFGLPAGLPMSSTLSQLFATNADLIKAFANPPLMGNGLPDPMVQQFVTITSDNPISLSVSRLNMNPDGSLVATAAFAFPLAKQ